MKKRLLSLALCLALCSGLFPFGALATGGGGIYVPPGSHTEGSGGTYTPPEDTRAEIWRDTQWTTKISRPYDGTTDGSTVSLSLTFTDGTNEMNLREGTDFNAVKTFDSAEVGDHTVTVEITLIGEAAAKYKLREAEESFTIDGTIDPAAQNLTLSLSKTTCAVGEKLLPLLSLSGVKEDAAVTYYYTPYKMLIGDSEHEGRGVPAIDENTVIDKLDEEGNNTYYLYAKTAATENYKADMSNFVELTVSNDVASVTTSSGVTNNYTSLDDALNAAQDGDTVTLLSDVDLGETSVTISKSITFDLNGKTLSSSKTWSSDGVLLVKDAAVTVKNGTVNATGIGNCAIHAYRSGASMTLEDVTATVTSDKSSVMVGDFGSAVIKSGDYQGLYVGAKSQVTLEGGTFRPYMDNITNKNVKSIFWKVNETTDATSRDCMELLGDGCVYVDENQNQVRTGGGFNTVVTVQQGTAIDAPVAKIGGVEYASLSKAINAVQNGGTITLLDDLDLDNGAVLQVGFSQKNFTIDLDNHTLSADGACLIMLHNGSQLTLKNGTLDGSRCTSYGGVLYISSKSGPKLTLENVTAKSGTVTGTLGQRSVLLAYVTYGTVVFDGGTYTGGVLLETNGNAVLKSGTFQKGTNDYSIKTKDSGKHLSDYLDDDSQFWNDNTPLDLSNKTQTADEVTVRPCEHKWENGKCTVCQKVCDHGSADGKSMTEDPCPTCEMKAAAQVDITGSDAKYFPSFNDALVYATKNDGSTLKLLADVVDVTVSTDKSFIFDLNGYKVYSLNVNSRITLKDSSEGKGKITEWLTVPSGMTIGELLEEGYAFRYVSTGNWCFGTEQAVGNVSVQQVPITSVTLDALNAKDNTDAPTTMVYGTTGGVKLSASCNILNLTTPDCKWYEVSGSLIPIDNVMGMNYFLPDDLIAGEHTYRVTFISDGYEKSAEITITVEKADLSEAEIEFPYGNEAAFNYATSTGVPTFVVKYNGTELEKDVDYTIAGGDSFSGVGSQTLTIKAKDNGNYTGSKSAKWTVRPLKVAASVGDIIKTYDGTTDLPANAKIIFKSADSYYTGTTLRLAKGTDYEVLDAKYDSANASTDEKTISFTIKLKNEGYVFEDGTKEKAFTLKGLETDKTFTITKAPALDTSTGTLTVANNYKGTYTFDLKALLPTLEAPQSYGTISYGTPEVSLNDGYYSSGAEINDGVLSLPIQANPVETTGKIGTVKVVVTTTNYENITLTLNVSAANKKVPTGTPTLSKTNLTYGNKLSDITLSGSMTDEENAVAGTFTWENPNEILTAGKHQAGWVFTPTDSAHYIEVTDKSEVTVDKATPSGTPSYTAITESGKTLEDAHLAVGTIQPDGYIQWVDADGNKINVSTEVKANTAYTWKFTPYDENYNDLTGTITLWHKSSSGSSSGSVTPGTKTDTVKNPDGSTTKTETKADGSKTETTTASSGGGSTGITVTKTDAKGNTTTEASAKLSDQDVKEAQEKGEAVTVPVKGIAAAKEANAATKIKIDVPNNANKTTVEIPVENVTSGTVAVIVHEDGTEELVKDSIPTESGVQLEISGSTTVKIIDNSKTFDDTKDHWSRDEVNFVAARELFNGVGGNQFGVSQPMTRGMVNTVLARLAGVDTTPGQGQAWYEVGTDWAKKNGISDGTNPTAPVTREQLATLLYRYAGSPSVSGTLHAADAASVSDYAEDALLWANQNGIVNGVGSNTIAPKDNAQRAQVAAMLARYLQNQ